MDVWNVLIILDAGCLRHHSPSPHQPGFEACAGGHGKTCFFVETPEHSGGCRWRQTARQAAPCRPPPASTTLIGWTPSDSGGYGRAGPVPSAPLVRPRMGDDLCVPGLVEAVVCGLGCLVAHHVCKAVRGKNS